VFDTILGCAIAFSACYFLFPDWEAGQLKKYMADVMLANAAYLQKVTESLQGKQVDKIEYKLARRQVYLQSANLSAAYQRMAAEPKKRQHNLQVVHQFLVRNHLLFSNIAHLAALLPESPKPFYELAQASQQAIQKLYGVSKKLDATGTLTETQPKLIQHPSSQTSATTADEVLLKTNVDFIMKLCDDICKTTEALLAA